MTQHLYSEPPTDWNLQNEICESFIVAVKKSLLHADILQIIFDFAYHINISKWQAHSLELDQYIEQMLYTEAIQIHLDSSPLQEFITQILFRSQLQFSAKNGCLVDTMYTFNSQHLRASYLKHYTIFTTQTPIPTTPITCKDWNLQNVICETMAIAHTQSTLTHQMVQIICEYAYNIHLPTWKVYANKYDNFMINFHLPVNLSIQDHIQEQINHQKNAPKEFLYEDMDLALAAQYPFYDLDQNYRIYY